MKKKTQKSAKIETSQSIKAKPGEAYRRSYGQIKFSAGKEEEKEETHWWAQEKGLELRKEEVSFLIEEEKIQ